MNFKWHSQLPHFYKAIASAWVNWDWLTALTAELKCVMRIDLIKSMRKLVQMCCDRHTSTNTFCENDFATAWMAMGVWCACVCQVCTKFICCMYHSFFSFNLRRRRKNSKKYSCLYIECVYIKSTWHLHIATYDIIIVILVAVSAAHYFGHRLTLTAIHWLLFLQQFSSFRVKYKP